MGAQDIRPRLALGRALGAALLALPILWMFAGFSVDDARIVARVAEHGRAGCFCFNPPEFTDAVTPLGYAQLVALVARSTGSTALLVQSVLGFASWTITVLLVGALARRREWPWLVGLLAVNIPFAAWAGAGLETALVTLAVTSGALFVDADRPRVGALLLGAAATWRPELAVFGAVVLLVNARRPLPEPAVHQVAPLDVAPANATERSGRRLLGQVLLLALPLFVVAALRVVWFGVPTPLSFQAKEPAFGAGFTYALFALLGTGAPPVAVVVDRSGWRWPIAAHFFALALAGGDWMPLYRLAVPVIPLAALVAARGLARPAVGLRWVRVAGSVLSIASAALLWVRFHERAPGVRAREEALIASVKPWLTGIERVASVDVGWVGAATTGEVVDLGGVTDPRVAALPGGHTSRPIAPGFFAARSVDGWLFRATIVASPPRSLADVSAVYVVDERLRRRADDLGFELIRTFERPGTGEVYVLARYRAPAVAR